jgi:hypothetical protein
MDLWTLETARKSIHAFDELSVSQQESLIAYCNEKFPPSVFEGHVRCRKQALVNVKESKELLSGALQKFPPIISKESVSSSSGDLHGVAIVLTAGGDGERLKKSLLAKGAPEKELTNFTKATFRLPEFFKDFGSLHANLCLIASLSRRLALDIPVVVTTGPAGSITARVIPEIIRANRQFGLRHIRVIEQDERLHLTMDDAIAYKINESGQARPITHPDETGGPLMKLKWRGGSLAAPPKDRQSILEWLDDLGCTKTIVLQATGLYDPVLLSTIAAAAKSRDCVGVGILRESFAPNDPFGTYVAIEKNAPQKVVIIEQEIRNQATLSLKDETRGYFLPYNTGLYAFDNELLLSSDLPDYATPPKEILPDLPKSPKIGYAATDIFGLAKNAAVLCIPSNSFAVIKTVDDLASVAALGKRFGIEKMCGELA